MKDFRFSLDSVLNIELQLEQMIDIRLAEARRRLDDAVAELDRMRRELVEYQESIRNEASQNLMTVSGWDSFHTRMQSLMEKQKVEIQNREVEFQAVLREKLERNQRIEGLRKLEDKEKKNYNLESNRKEQGRILDSILLRRNRN